MTIIRPILPSRLRCTECKGERLSTVLQRPACPPGAQFLFCEDCQALILIAPLGYEVEDGEGSRLVRLEEWWEAKG